MVPVVTGTAGQVTVFSPYCQFQRARAGGGGLPNVGVGGEPEAPVGPGE